MPVQSRVSAMTPVFAPTAGSSSGRNTFEESRTKISSRPKKLSLIHVHLYHAERRRKEFYLDVRRYFPSLLFLIILYANMHSTASFVRQAEWMRSILLEDEFTDPTQTVHKDYAKNSFSVESLEDIWDWGESLVLGSFYQSDAEEPALLFDHNLLVGAIQIMQVCNTTKVVIMTALLPLYIAAVVHTGLLD